MNPKLKYSDPQSICFYVDINSSRVDVVAYTNLYTAFTAYFLEGFCMCKLRGLLVIVMHYIKVSTLIYMSLVI